MSQRVRSPFGFQARRGGRDVEDIFGLLEQAERRLGE
jgi:hypothetical protein